MRSANIPLSYLSRQLGRADVGVTARHYARWVGGGAYRAPLTLARGEVPADLLARLGHTPGTVEPVAEGAVRT